MEEDKLPIEVVYRRFWETAKELAQDDIKKFPLGSKEAESDTVEKHLLGMIEMYAAPFTATEEVGYFTRELAHILNETPDNTLRSEVNNLLLRILSRGRTQLEGGV